MPIFLSVFFGLRGMAELPVESMRTGGALWFSDLTIPDAYYGLPLLTSLTLFITLEAISDLFLLFHLTYYLHFMQFIYQWLSSISVLN